MSGLMSIGVTAMSASYAALQTASNNIANANVAGYSRQQAVLATAPGQFTGAGFFGQGVNITTIGRAYNGYLTSQATTAASQSSMDSTRLTQLQGLQNLFPTDSTGLASSVSTLFGALSDVANNPSDPAARQVVIGDAQNLASSFNQVSQGLDQLQAGVTQQLQTSVAGINSLAQSIAQVNQQLASMRGLNQPDNSLLDKRDQLVAQLSQQIAVTQVTNDDGTVSLFVAGGQSLVLGPNATPLSVVQDPSDPSRSALAFMDGTTARPLDSSALGGGTVAGLLAFQNQDLVDARNQVGQLAAAVGGALNQQQAFGLDLSGATGSAMFSLASPLAIPNAANAKDPSGSPIGSVALTVTDPSALQASDYALSASSSTPGSWDVTRLSDGKVFTVANGGTVDGMQINVSNAQPGDRFLLQPVGNAASSITSVLTSPAQIAAAAPLVAASGSANTGTATPALTMTASPVPTSGATASVSFTDNSGNYSWQLVDSGGNVLGSGTGTWSAGATIPPSGSNINGFSLTLSGVPKAGDTFSVAPTAANAVATNNGNALAAVALQNAAIVAGQSVTSSWSQTIADVGMRVQSAQSLSTISSTRATQAQQALTSVTGVNLDEEAASLIQYQQSYQAAAKVLQVAQTLFDTLIQAAGA